jgi:dTDP-4-amino-4,6-dideoxygalactose transaminase
VVAPLFGGVPPQDEIRDLLDERGIPWVEDVAQAFGSRRAGRPAGSAAPLAVLSTNFDKPFTTGRGGVLVVNDAALVPTVEGLVASLPEQTRAEADAILKGLVISDYLFDAETYEPFVSVDLGYLYAAAEGDAYDLADLVNRGAGLAARNASAARQRLMPSHKPPLVRRLIRWFFPSSAVPPLGSGKRLAPMLAALGNRHLAALQADGARRRKLAASFDGAFADGASCRAPNWGCPGDEPWPIRYPLFLRDWARRPEVIARLAAAGYEAGPFIYPRPLSGMFPYYKLSRTTGRYLRGAWRAAAALVNLPLHAGVSEDDVRKMAEAVRG